MESAYTYYASGNIIHQNKLAWFSIIWTACIAVLLAIFLGIYFSKIKHESKIVTQNYLLYALTYICGILLINFFTVLFYARKNFFTPNIILGSINLVLVIVMIIVHRYNYSYTFLVKGYFVAILIQGIFLAVSFLYLNQGITQFLLPQKSEIRLMFKYALIALAGNLLFFFMYKIDYWFVKYYCSANALGNYIQASKLAQMVLIIPQILASVIFPHTAEGSKQNDVGKSILILFRVMLQVFVVLILLVWLFGAGVFIKIFGITFNQLHIPFLILLPGIFSISVSVLLAAFFSGNGLGKLNVIGTGVGLLIVIILDLLLINKYGIIGAAISSSVGYFGFLCFGLFNFNRLHPFGFKQLFNFSVNDWLWVKKVIVTKKQDS
jgi:O-antigen/teichoic acid export membrane protein